MFLHDLRDENISGGIESDIFPSPCNLLHWEYHLSPLGGHRVVRFNDFFYFIFIFLLYTSCLKSDINCQRQLIL